MKRGLKKIYISCFLCLVLSHNVAVPVPVYAFDSGTVLSIMSLGIQYGMIYFNLKYLDNSGRDAMLAGMKREYGVSKNKKAEVQLEGIMQRLVSVISAEDPSLAEKPYQYFVNSQTSFNAFCTLGHNISINAGTFDILDYEESEIAFVIAHELAHGQNGDPLLNQLKRSSVFTLASLIAGGDSSSVELIALHAAGDAAQAKFITMPAEKAADRRAFDFCSKAGFNPGAGAALWQRVMDKTDKKSTAFLSAVFGDHPSNLSRRDLYALDMNSWSKGTVAVDGVSGAVNVAGKYVFTPMPHNDRSRLELAYLAAGRIAGIYHYIDSLVHVPVAEYRNGTVFIGKTAVYETTPGEDGDKIADALNAAAGKNIKIQPVAA